jgi:hypothetical protein
MIDKNHCIDFMFSVNHANYPIFVKYFSSYECPPKIGLVIVKNILKC